MVAFALDLNGQRVPITHGMVRTWLVDMFRGPLTVPPVNKWYKIPDEHLHSGIVVAYVNFVQFMEQNGMDVVLCTHNDDHRKMVWWCDSCGGAGVFERRCSNDCCVHDHCMVEWAALIARIGGCSECSATQDPRPLITPQLREQNREELINDVPSAVTI